MAAIISNSNTFTINSNNAGQNLEGFNSLTLFISRLSTQYHLLIIWAWVSFNLIEAVRGYWLTENPYKWWSSGWSLTNKEMVGAGLRKLPQVIGLKIGTSWIYWIKLVRLFLIHKHAFTLWGKISNSVLMASLRAELLCSFVWGYWTSPPKGQFLGAQRNQEWTQSDLAAVFQTWE